MHINMKRSIISVFIILIVVCFGTPSVSQNSENSRSENFHTLCRYLNKNHMFNGNILIAEKGKPVCECTIGYASLENKQRLTENSIFELASVSKQFTATGILILVEEGEICVDQLVDFILPDFPYTDITIRNLLTHTSGLPAYEELFEKYWDRSKIATNKDVLDMLRKYAPPVHFAPGDQWEYSNTGYVMLACIIEQVSGLPYAEFMKEYVFEPLGLHSTLVYSRRYSPGSIPDYAYGYVKDHEENSYVLPDLLPSEDYVIYLDGIQGDGCVNSTAEDLVKWCQAVQRKDLISEKWWDEALRPSVLNNGDTTDYGFGWRIEKDSTDGRIISHGGGWPGYRTFDIQYLDKDITLVYLCNIEPASRTQHQILQAMKDIANERPFQMPSVPVKRKVAGIDKSIYKLYAGTYCLDSATVVTITTDGEKLLAQRRGGTPTEILPVSKSRFFVPGSETEIEFLKDGQGKITSIAILQLGTTILIRQEE